MRKAQVDSILLDLDGTLIETAPMVRKVLQILLKKYQNTDVTDELLKEIRGIPGRRVFERINPENVDEVILEGVRLENMHRDLAPMYPDVLTLIWKLTENGIPLGVITSQARKEMEAVQQSYPFADFIQVWISADDVEFPKPHPQSVYQGLDALGVSAETNLFIGDTRYDIQAGKQAGVITGAAIWGRNDPQDLLLLKPDYVFTTPLEVSQLVFG